jgi:hypothetical protein
MHQSGRPVWGWRETLASKNHQPSPHAPQVRLLQQNRPQADSCTAAILPHVVGVAQRGQGRVPLRFSGGISIDKNFKIDAAQQLHTVVCFNFSLFHLCHTLVNSSSRSRDQIEQIL